MVDFLDGMREVSKSSGRKAAKIAGKTQGLFSSMLSGLGNKLEAALSLGSEDGDSNSEDLSGCNEGRGKRSKNGNTNGATFGNGTQLEGDGNGHGLCNGRRVSSCSDSSGGGLSPWNQDQAYYFSDSLHPKRRLPKPSPGYRDRSVYGQPPCRITTGQGFQKNTRIRSDLDRAKEVLDAQAAAADANGTVQDPFERLRHHPSKGTSTSDHTASSDDNEPSTISVDSSDVDGRKDAVGRSTSEASLQSWASSLSYDSQPDEHTVECMEFMKKFIDELFKNSASIALEEKARFGELCRLEAGRLWFARYINTQRVNNKKVDESTFYSLIQYFAIVLFECFEADDFSPAKSLMNMCFTYYHEVAVPGCEPFKEFLYTYLKDQHIWQSLRFWNAAFFDAVQCERSHRPVATREDFEQYIPDEIMDERTFQENITFGQLGTFTCNMHAFGLSKELCLEFLRKQSTIANLKPEQDHMLRENVERMYRETQGWR